MKFVSDVIDQYLYAPPDVKPNKIKITPIKILIDFFKISSTFFYAPPDYVS
jgi:hypothetical protein